VRSGVTFFTTKVAEVVIEGYLGKSGATDIRLTPRQREVIQLLAEGRSSKEIAVTLGLSVKTADTHRANIMQRLNCHSVTEIVRYAVRNNIIDA
jgi:DNA-binding NarL/FixJ family response regulator